MYILATFYSLLTEWRSEWARAQKWIEAKKQQIKCQIYPVFDKIAHTHTHTNASVHNQTIYITHRLTVQNDHTYHKSNQIKLNMLNSFDPYIRIVFTRFCKFISFFRLCFCCVIPDASLSSLVPHIFDYKKFTARANTKDGISWI